MFLSILLAEIFALSTLVLVSFVFNSSGPACNTTFALICFSCWLFIFLFLGTKRRPLLAKRSRRKVEYIISGTGEVTDTVFRRRQNDGYTLLSEEKDSRSYISSTGVLTMTRVVVMEKKYTGVHPLWQLLLCAAIAYTSTLLYQMIFISAFEAGAAPIELFDVMSRRIRIDTPILLGNALAVITKRLSLTGQALWQFIIARGEQLAASFHVLQSTAAGFLSNLPQFM